QLSVAACLPDAVHLAFEDLAGIEVKRNLDRLTDVDEFETLRVEAGQQVAVGFADEGGDRAHAQVTGHHSRTNLQVDDATVLRCNQSGVIQVIECLVQFGLDFGHAGVYAADLG